MQPNGWDEVISAEGHRFLSQLGTAGISGLARRSPAALAGPDPVCEPGQRITTDVQIGGSTAVLQSSRDTAAYRAIAYCNRGHAYATMEDYDRAIVDYSEAIRLNPSFAGAYNNRAWAYFKAGKAADGLPDVQ